MKPGRRLTSCTEDGPPVRAAPTRLIPSATEAVKAVNQSPVVLQVFLDDLQDKDMTPENFNDRISDLIIDDAEYDAELMAALQYHDTIRNMMSRVRPLLNSALRLADSTAPLIATATES
ncbi:hypothetical protein MRX96_058819 [Rhipicephalus microplus]